MHRRGVTEGEVGETHQLTEDRQGKFQFTMGPYSEPAITIRPGDRIVTETLDAFGGLIKTEKDSPSEKLVLPFLNPQNGPILVEGAEKGDGVAIHIESLMPRRGYPRVTLCMIPRAGGLTSTG